MEKILVINPGSTSTKIAFYEAEKEVWKESAIHSREDLGRYKTIYDQLEMRLDTVESTVKKHGMDFFDFDVVVSRGGPIAPMKSGAYEINDVMVKRIYEDPQDVHPSILGALIADGIAKKTKARAFVYDAVSVDEMLPVCHITGLPFVPRVGQGHFLNMRAAALRYCEEKGLDYKKVNLLVAHLGGGITTSLHMQGRIVDMSNDEEGPFAPERAGCIPATPFMKLCFSGEYDMNGVQKLLKGNGGLAAWFGTNDTRAIEEMIEKGDEKAKLVYEAMALGVSKALLKLTPLCEGKVDCIVLTGGIAYSGYFTGMIRKQVEWLCPVEVIPGENEMKALAEGALRVIRGKEGYSLME